MLPEITQENYIIYPLSLYKGSKHPSLAFSLTVMAVGLQAPEVHFVPHEGLGGAKHMQTSISTESAKRGGCLTELTALTHMLLSSPKPGGRDDCGPLFAAPASSHYPQQGSGARKGRTARAASRWPYSRKPSCFSVLEKSRVKAANKQNRKTKTKASSQLHCPYLPGFSFLSQSFRGNKPTGKAELFQGATASPPASLYPSPPRQLSHRLNNSFKNQHLARRQPQGSCPRPSSSQAK